MGMAFNLDKVSCFFHSWVGCVLNEPGFMSCIVWEQTSKWMGSFACNCLLVKIQRKGTENWVFEKGAVYQSLGGRKLRSPD